MQQAAAQAHGLLMATVHMRVWSTAAQVALFLGLVWAMLSGKGLGVRFRGLPNTAGGALAGELSAPASSQSGMNSGAATEHAHSILLSFS